MHEYLKDLRFGLRQLRLNPGFTLAALVCLALGIGANATAFSFAYNVLVRTPPLRGPERLVRIFTRWENGLEYGSFSYPDYVDVRQRSGEVLEALAAETITPVHLSVGGENERVWASMVSIDYFSDLGVPMALGRGFSAADGDAPGQVPLAVLLHRAWMGRFGGDPGVIGRQVSINGHPFTVVGVMDEAFLGSNVGISTDLYVPLLMQDQIRPNPGLLERRGSHWITFVIGRMRPGVSFEQAEQYLQGLMEELRRAYPDSNEGKSVRLYREAEAALHPMVRKGFVDATVLLFVVVGLILLLACTNVAGLLLARAAARRREIGIRMALGASRRRLVHQLLAESGVLAAIAALLGLGLSFALSRLLVSAVPATDIPMYMEARLRSDVVLFTLLVTVATGLTFGLLPALQATRPEVVPDLKEGAPGQSGVRATRWRQLLVAGQVAMSMVLLVSAGFVLRSLHAVHAVDPGFTVANQLVANLDLVLQGYDDEEARIFRRDLRRRLESRSEIEAVGFAQLLPLSLSSSQDSVVPEGHEDLPRAERPTIDRNLVDHGYFEAAGVHILRGRGFRESDDHDSPPVMVVNQAFADRFWPGEDPLGKRVRTSDQDFEVVGVAQNGKYFTLGEAQKPYFYRSMSQTDTGTLVLHARTRSDPRRLIPVVRREVEALDPHLPVAGLKTMESHLQFALTPARMMAAVVAVFAIVALVLAAVGLYGILAYWVNQGVREIAVRMALGADRRDVVVHVVRRGMLMTATGLIAGLAASIAASRLLAGVVYGVSAFEPLAFGGALVVLGGVALLAASLPARRAARLDPIEGLRP